MSQPKNSVDKLRLLLDEIEESILRASDEETVEETHVAGKESEAVADEVGSLIRSSVQGHRQRKLRDAQEGYRQSVIRQKRRRYAIPGTPAERRILLDSILANREDVPREITMAFRDGGHMSDDDVASILEDLAEFGFLSEDDKGST